MKLTVFQQNVRIRSKGYEYYTSYKVNGKLVYQEMVNESITKQTYEVCGEEVTIKKAWKIVNNSESCFEEGEYEIVFRRRWNYEYGFYEKTLIPYKVISLKTVRWDSDTKEQMRWGIEDEEGIRYYYSFREEGDDGDFFSVVMTNHKARKRILEVISEWKYDIE